MSGIEGPVAVHPPEDDDDDELDETLGERLWGLTEMFPDAVRGAAEVSVSLAKSAYVWSRTGLWVATTSFMILVLPVLLELEGLQLDEQHLQQQRDVLFGPSVSVSGRMLPPAPGKV